MAADLNCNMLRCWGGNVYESDAFYDFCDENGILVWQDFSLACTTPPQDDAFAKAMEEEARSVVERLRGHPVRRPLGGRQRKRPVVLLALQFERL